MTVDELISESVNTVVADSVVSKTSEHEVVQEESSPAATESCMPETVNKINNGQNETGIKIKPYGFY